MTESLATITLLCPSCGARLAFTPGGERFTCEYCGNSHFFNLASALTTGGARAAGARAAEELPLPGVRLEGAAPAVRAEAEMPLPAPRPGNIVVAKTPAGLELSWRWFGPKYIFLGFFALFWDAFLCLWYGLALMMAPDVGAIIMMIFPLLHVGIGVALSYVALAGLFNRSSVRLADGRFTLEHGPLPWPGKVDVSAPELEQLYCKEKRTRGKHGYNYSYQLCAVLRDGRRLDLVSGLDTPDLARFLEQELEAHLHIANRGVAGELVEG